MDKEIGWLLQEKYNGKMTVAAKKDIKRLKAGEPLDHIIGFVDFLGCKILVDGKVLIPRFETEFWTEQVINDLRVQKGRLRILDIFAGSGCIGIAVLKHIKNVNIVFADSETNTLSQIEKNCKVNKIPKNRYEIIESDVFLNIKGEFDYIVANPPYISDYRNNPSVQLRTILRNRIQKSVIKYEPKEALFGGKDGLLYIVKFLAEAKKFLNPGGKMYMEFDTPQRNKINMLLKKFRYKSWRFHKDQYDKFRWVVIDN